MQLTVNLWSISSERHPYYLDTIEPSGRTHSGSDHLGYASLNRNWHQPLSRQ